jgi:undecaprenyl-diphosphatase
MMPAGGTIFDFFQPFDTEVLRMIHAHARPALDSLMIFWSDRRVWFPFYVLLLAFWYRKEGKSKTLTALLVIASSILITDQIASSVLKPLTQRLRPCHEPSLQAWLHLPAGCGGKFGFVSSHAGNSIALSVCVFRLFPRQKFLFAILLIWSGITAYSRMYLGAHYPSDIAGGWLIGIISASLSIWMITRAKVMRSQLQKQSD